MDGSYGFISLVKVICWVMCPIVSLKGALSRKLDSCMFENVLDLGGA